MALLESLLQYIMGMGQQQQPSPNDDMMGLLPNLLQHIMGMPQQPVGSPKVPEEFRSLFAEISAKYPNVDPNMAAGLIEQESNWRSAIPAQGQPGSSSVGLSQAIDSTWKQYGYDPKQKTDPATSMEFVFRHMGDLNKWSGGDQRKSLAAYNQGRGGWKKGLGYADSVLNKAKKYGGQ